MYQPPSIVPIEKVAHIASYVHPTSITIFFPPPVVACNDRARWGEQNCTLTSNKMAISISTVLLIPGYKIASLVPNALRIFLGKKQH
jgi:hypothetical protein